MSKESHMPQSGSEKPPERDIEDRIAVFEAEQGFAKRDTIPDIRSSAPPQRDTFVDLDTYIPTPEEQVALDKEAAEKTRSKQERNLAPQNPDEGPVSSTVIPSPEDALEMLKHRAKSDSELIQRLSDAEKDLSELTKKHQPTQEEIDVQNINIALAHERAEEAKKNLPSIGEEHKAKPEEGTARPPARGRRSA